MRYRDINNILDSVVMNTDVFMDGMDACHLQKKGQEN